ncbi:hypothetical protein Salat_1854100 [Sesamum alatum]|uniref:Transmembrane protein n=1 Tax=Sesamum alatum TaxID=300844 RepID=A0AAE1Y3U8_9LAMI|nr:hypothetical protein Salat_1854100 [Sesamum alatum]
MGFIFPLTLILLSLATPEAAKPEIRQIKSARILDLVIRDYTFKSYNKNSFFRTGKLQQINLPANLSGINVDTMRVRCGSLQRYGARIKEFYLGSGANVHPCIERVMLVRQNLGSEWSSVYYDSYELSGYQLISPVLGLLAYSLADKNYSTIPSELGIKAGKKPITIDFSSTNLLTIASGISPLCASFEHDGRVVLSNQTRPNVCIATKDGHFGLVVESTLVPLKGKVVSKGKIVIVSSIGGALGACLLSLLMIAMFVNAKKKKERMDELERRAYEEEALQVSMVGHVRALTASGTRTVPTIERHEYQYRGS